MITCVVLAAGEATRMGQVKQLLDAAGKPLLQHVVDAAEASRADQVVVVLGAHADDIEAQLRLTRSVVVRNPEFRRGNVSSLSCGASAVPQSEAVVLLMGDQPETATEAVDVMVNLWAQSRPWAAVLRYDDRIGHPYLLSQDCLETAVAAAGPKRLWKLLVESGDERVVAVPHPGVAPADVNTPADYEALRGRLHRPEP